MIDEPLALLAEAFGQDPDSVILPFTGNGTSENDAVLPVIATLSVGQVESPAFAARNLSRTAS